jgi:hypothetical protein
MYIHLLYVGTPARASGADVLKIVRLMPTAIMEKETLTRALVGQSPHKKTFSLISFKLTIRHLHCTYPKLKGIRFNLNSHELGTTVVVQTNMAHKLISPRRLNQDDCFVRCCWHNIAKWKSVNSKSWGKPNIIYLY